MSEKPLPVFYVGECVRVILNERNRTSHTGPVREIIWHHKDRCYNYYITAGGKKVSKRYYEEDLERVPEDGNHAEVKR